MIAIGGVIVSFLTAKQQDTADMRRALDCFWELALIWLMVDLQVS